MLQKDLTILVNTSDNFDDCWMPFFTLFRRFWPDCAYPIVLNTETKDFCFEGLSLQCAKVANGESRRLTWSECLARCLDGIHTPYILYLQEDFFLEAPVRTDFLQTFLNEIRAGNADVIRLLECDGAGPWQPTEHPLLWAVARNAKYRISLQAVLWRKSVLRSYLRAHESPWQLEIFGSARARRKKHNILCVNREIFSCPDQEIFPYQATGVVSGQWKKDIVEPLFAKHGIIIDFERRGFYDAQAPKIRKRPVINRLYDRLRSVV